MLKTANSKEGSARRVVVSLLIGAYVSALSTFAGAFGHQADPDAEPGGSCLFSVQLQSSVSARREYLVSVERYGAAENAVEEMYGGIDTAASDPEDSRRGPGGGLFPLLGRRPAQQLLRIDAFSADCVSCHDGASASMIEVNLRDRPLGRKPQIDSFRTNHPIGMSYNYYVAARKGYKPIGGNSRMILVNGKVGCLTCHDPLNPEKGHLVMSDRDSALCLTCHDK